MEDTGATGEPLGYCDAVPNENRPVRNLLGDNTLDRLHDRRNLFIINLVAELRLEPPKRLLWRPHAFLFAGILI